LNSMKKILYFLTFIACSSLVAQNFNSGLSAGFTTSQISGDYLEGYNKLGFNFGAYIAYPISEKTEVNLATQFIQKGSKKPYIENSPENYSFVLNYFELALSLDYYYKAGFSIETGIAPCLLISYSEQRDDVELLENKPNSLCLDFLIGVKYDLNDKYAAKVRYNQSLTPVRSSGIEAESLTNRGQYSSLISFSIIHQFNN
jgi:hypothetical protein